MQIEPLACAFCGSVAEGDDLSIVRYQEFVNSYHKVCLKYLLSEGRWYEAHGKE